MTSVRKQIIDIFDGKYPMTNAGIARVVGVTVKRVEQIVNQHRDHLQKQKIKKADEPTSPKGCASFYTARIYDAKRAMIQKGHTVHICERTGIITLDGSVTQSNVLVRRAFFPNS